MTNTITAKIWLIYIIFYLSWWYVCRNYGKSNMIWKCRLFMFVFFKFLLFSSWYGTVCGVYCPGATSQSQGLHPAAGGTAGVWCFLGRWKKKNTFKIYISHDIRPMYVPYHFERNTLNYCCCPQLLSKLPVLISWLKDMYVYWIDEINW